MLSRASLRQVAQIALCAMAFTQAAVAFAACETVMPGAVEAIAQSGMTCHEPQQSANLCVSHCLASDQSLDKPSLFVPLLPAAVLTVVVPSAAKVEHAVASPTRAPITGPPIRILFRSFLI